MNDDTEFQGCVSASPTPFLYSSASSVSVPAHFGESPTHLSEPLEASSRGSHSPLSFADAPRTLEDTNMPTSHVLSPIRVTERSGAPMRIVSDVVVHGNGTTRNGDDDWTRYHTEQTSSFLKDDDVVHENSQSVQGVRVPPSTVHATTATVPKWKARLLRNVHVAALIDELRKGTTSLDRIRSASLHRWFTKYEVICLLLATLSNARTDSAHPSTSSIELSSGVPLSRPTGGSFYCYDRTKVKRWRSDG